MTEGQKRAIHALAFGRQHEMAVRAALAIGGDAVKYAIDRVMVGEYIYWIRTYLKPNFEITDSLCAKPFEKVVMKTEQARVKRHVKALLKKWGLQDQVTV